MLEGKQLIELAIGDVVEAGPIFQNVSDEPICFKLTKKSSGEARVILDFEVWYFSIPIGEWAVKVDPSDDYKTTWVDVESVTTGKEQMTMAEMAVTRTFADRCADILYMRLELEDTRVRGSKKVVLDLNGLNFPFELKVVGHWADTGKSQADAGLLLQGPSLLGVAVYRAKNEFHFCVFDQRQLEPKRESLAKWWSAVRGGVVESSDFTDLITAASRGSWMRKEGAWVPV